MKDALAGLPAFKKLQASYSSHISLANKCIDIFKERKLEVVAQLEQDTDDDRGESEKQVRYAWNASNLVADNHTLSRFVPAVKRILQYTGATKGTVIVYIAGGMTLSEMRSAYEMANELGRDIYIGSTHVITPERFLGDLRMLHHKTQI
ncbi:syntaxin binding protein 1 [Dipsacomyces acuminosporus]|nr:syntaxin binding protein 1 [Dipsacomyces acuminosporus]